MTRERNKNLWHTKAIVILLMHFRWLSVLQCGVLQIIVRGYGTLYLINSIRDGRREVQESERNLQGSKKIKSQSSSRKKSKVLNSVCEFSIYREPPNKNIFILSFN